MDPKIKNRSRLFYLMANIEVSMMKGNDNWALLLDTNGFPIDTGNNMITDVKVGQWILVAHGRWSRAFKVSKDGVELEVRMIDENEVLNEDDLLVDIFSLNDLDTDTVRLNAATIKQLFEDTNYTLSDVRKKKLVKPIYFTQFPRDLDELQSTKLKKETIIKIQPTVKEDNIIIFKTIYLNFADSEDMTDMEFDVIIFVDNSSASRSF